MTNKVLLSQINSVEKIAYSSKWRRLLHNPFKYVYAILFRSIIYPRSHKERILTCDLFYGKQMKIGLPASTDIYLTGGKSHSSEIRLAKFLILNLAPGDKFMDIGAHYGYFTLLAAEIVGAQGNVLAFEPSGKSFYLLKENTNAAANISILNKAVSNTKGILSFYEFENLYSEYNAADVSQFENEAWYKAAKPQKVEVEALSIDHVTHDRSFTPSIIKIDVEGAENLVIEGATNLLKNHSPMLVMEYLEPKRKNETHKQATISLRNLGYHPHLITDDGGTIPVSDIDDYLVSNNMESDNIVFIKK